MARRNAYYQQLEQAQSGGLDITQWLVWFLDTLEEALQQALLRMERVLTPCSGSATRDLIELLEKGCLAKLPGGGRNTRYRVRFDNNDKEMS